MNELKKRATNAFCWLYRNDRDWLAKHQPLTSRMQNGIVSSRIDWSLRDRTLAEKVHMAATAILGMPNLPRVSVTALLRATGTEDSVRRNLNKLPQLRLAISLRSESSNAFRARRLQIAYQSLVESGLEEPMNWQVWRKAGLRHLSHRQQCG